MDAADPKLEASVLILFTKVGFTACLLLWYPSQQAEWESRDRKFSHH